MRTWSIGILSLVLLLIASSCATFYEDIDGQCYSHQLSWNRDRVLRWLEQAQDTHIRNRGLRNSPEFDDWCAKNYQGIILWIEENTE